VANETSSGRIVIANHGMTRLQIDKMAEEVSVPVRHWHKA